MLAIVCTSYDLLTNFLSIKYQKLIKIIRTTKSQIILLQRYLSTISFFISERPITLTTSLEQTDHGSTARFHYEVGVKKKGADSSHRRGSLFSWKLAAVVSHVSA